MEVKGYRERRDEFGCILNNAIVAYVAFQRYRGSLEYVDVCFPYVRIYTLLRMSLYHPEFSTRIFINEIYIVVECSIFYISGYYYKL